MDRLGAGSRAYRGKARGARHPHGRVDGLLAKKQARARTISREPSRALAPAGAATMVREARHGRGLEPGAPPVPAHLGVTPRVPRSRISPRSPSGALKADSIPAERIGESTAVVLIEREHDRRVVGVLRRARLVAAITERQRAEGRCVVP